MIKELFATINLVETLLATSLAGGVRKARGDGRNSGKKDVASYVSTMDFFGILFTAAFS
jgi:hypothetical protein